MATICLDSGITDQRQQVVTGTLRELPDEVRHREEGFPCRHHVCVWFAAIGG
ncbi:hypothetical protein ACFSEO_13350 [Agromyces cerinus subsp. nitratus]|uniref:hypothetical protein n=1 Tax=Agromyces cerinus TaxID=33878 RepID=UPI00362AF4E4